MKKAIYAASLDPITYGHKNLIERALNVFDHILVAIGVNEAKKPLFSLEERVAMAKKELASFGNKIKIVSFQGMLSDFAYENGIKTIIRGARSSPDFDYEKLIGDINRYCGVDTVIYTSTPELSHISSSAAKAITLNVGKNILDFVSIDVKRKLEEALLYQYRIGITGMIGSGKSSIADEFINYLWNGNIFDHPSIHADVHLIDMDTIGHYILEEGKEPICHEVRQKLSTTFDTGVQKKNGFMNVKKISYYVFKDYNYRKVFDNIMREPMMYLLRKKLLDKKGTENKKSIILIVGALLCESEGLSEFNNNLILVDTPEKDIISRLKEKRKYSDEEIKNRMTAQGSFEVKLKLANSEIEKHNSGKIWTINNRANYNEYNRGVIFRDILNTLHLEK